MYCPHCNTEYRDAFTTCADCGATLASGRPPHPAPQPTPLYDVARLVEVFFTDDLFQADVAASVLGGEGIKAIVRPWLPSGVALSAIERPMLGQHAVCVAEPQAG